MEKRELNLIQYPSGRYGFVGFQLPVQLVWKNKDGSPLTEKDMEVLSYHPTPAMTYKGVSFESIEAAEKEANKYDCTVKV